MGGYYEHLQEKYKESIQIVTTQTEPDENADASEFAQKRLKALYEIQAGKPGVAGDVATYKDSNGKDVYVLDDVYNISEQANDFIEVLGANKKSLSPISEEEKNDGWVELSDEERATEWKEYLGDYLTVFEKKMVESKAVSEDLIAGIKSGVADQKDDEQLQEVGSVLSDLKQSDAKIITFSQFNGMHADIEKRPQLTSLKPQNGPKTEDSPEPDAKPDPMLAAQEPQPDLDGQEQPEEAPEQETPEQPEPETPEQPEPETPEQPQEPEAQQPETPPQDPQPQAPEPRKTGGGSKQVAELSQPGKLNVASLRDCIETLNNGSSTDDLSALKRMEGVLRDSGMKDVSFDTSRFRQGEFLETRVSQQFVADYNNIVAAASGNNKQELQNAVDTLKQRFVSVSNDEGNVIGSRDSGQIAQHCTEVGSGRVATTRDGSITLG